MRPGQRLLSISDPMSATGMWDLNDRPSVRFVRDALAMRSSSSIDLVCNLPIVFDGGPIIVDRYESVITAVHHQP